jgi:hypothetical protein
MRTHRAAAPLWLPLLLALGACSSWREVHEYDGWTLYESERAVDAAAFAAAFEPAVRSIEEHFGEFERNVRVHAWNGAVELGPAGRGIVHENEGDGVQDVPGIGPARVQAYHSRDSGRLFAADAGIYVAAPDAGTAAHELVHARLAELDVRVPLWFEEGIATVFGDGALVDGRWRVDGLACWPLRELRENPLGDEELAALLVLEAIDAVSVRDNVLAHFVGWAIVFDLLRETRSLDWRVWQRAFDWQRPAVDARARLERTLAAATPLEWLRRLEHDDPGLRFAACKGTWKLHEEDVVLALMDALEREQDDEVRVALAINILASGNDVRLGRRDSHRARAAIHAALTTAELDAPDEQRAVRELARGVRWGGERAQLALEALRRYWEE